MSLKHEIGLFINRNRRNPVVARLARLAQNIYWASEHAGYDVMRNGESAVLREILCGEAAPIVLDVGANKGDWSACVLQEAPSAQVHAIEASPTTVERLNERFRSEQRVRVHACGLAEQSGTITFFNYPDSASELSGGRIALHSHVTPEKLLVPAFAGDEFCARNGISRLDLLKVDVEGLDLAVLRGFKNMLATKKIKAIQFELEGGCYLKDFYELLEPLGFKIGKLYSSYVDFRPHTASLEWFLGPNYIAVDAETSRRSIEKLKAGW